MSNVSDLSPSGTSTARDSASPLTPFAPARCANCSASLATPFCGACGQRRAVRLTTRGLLGETFQHLAELDLAFVRTFAALWSGPGRVAREYVDGARKRWSSPAKYAFFSFTVYVLAVNLLKLELVPAGSPFSQPEQHRVFRIVFSVVAYLLFVNLIPVSLLQRWLFRRERFNVLESYVFGLYTYGHLAWIHLAVAATGVFGTMWGFPAVQLFGIGWVAWSVTSFYGRRSVGTVLKGALLGLAYAAVGFAIGGIVARLAFAWRIGG